MQNLNFKINGESQAKSYKSWIKDYLLSLLFKYWIWYSSQSQLKLAIEMNRTTLYFQPEILHIGKRK